MEKNTLDKFITKKRKTDTPITEEEKGQEKKTKGKVKNI